VENLPNSLIRPPGSLTAPNTAHSKLPEVGGLAEEVRQICEADPGKFEVFEVQKSHAVVVHQRNVLVVQVEQVVGGFLNTKTLQTGTRVDQSREGEVIRGNEFQRVNVLPHEGDVGGMLRQGDV